MLFLSQSVKFIRKAAALLLLPLLAWSCQLVMGDYDDELTADSTTPQYINITISVSAGNNPMTRANPNGGEYGDGPETGSERENTVNNITLIFYQDDAGINTTSTNTAVACVKKYAVHPYDETYYPMGHHHKEGEPYDVQAGEVLYTTGEQKLEETTLVAGQTYRVLVVANAPEGLVINAGEKIATVRDRVLSSIYSGSGVGINATNFVMASESDATISLTNPTLYTSATEAEKNRYVYYFDCIHIERLAARLDFWAKNSNGFKTSSDNAAYTTSGYEYTVRNNTGQATLDRFVLTSITPFNLNNGTGSVEYLFKRTNDVANRYLHNEVPTTSASPGNWVFDPTSLQKPANPSATSHPAYFASTLTSVVSSFTNDFTVTMAGQKTNAFDVTNGNVTADNIIVGYAKENTLNPAGTSSLYYYATGLAFEGYYYSGGTGTGTHCVFYHFIRHQGESNSAYQAYTSENINTAKNAFCPAIRPTNPDPATPAMNYGIVRNNIYRISIDKVSVRGSFIQLSIKEMRWRNVDNPTIYI
ncbi:MAG: hypothetical protein K6D37_08545 [Prevotella sp.]|nr:hypothetical protein [Prevotella sp.]